MDSDLSLLEISGEDDSLLSQIEGDDALIRQRDEVNYKNNYFLCSPLQIHGSKRSADPPPRPPVASPIVCTKVASEHPEKPSSSLQMDSTNKENVNASKSEVPKVSPQPQQMKRRKKGGGYNLRKSLAWDRAFFTEEGVLDPVELSMINEGFSKVGGESLSSVPEEGRESLSGVLDCARESSDLHTPEENFYEGLSRNSVKKNRNGGFRLAAKQGSPTRENVAQASEAKPKVLSAHDINRSGSKRSGCPRPAASSSLKRPTNVSTTKAATKESKLSKIPVPKLDSSSIPRTTKGTALGASNSKRNEISQPATDVQRKIRSKASLGNNRSVQNNAKAGPANKSLAVRSSVRQAKRHVVSSASEKRPSTNLPRPSGSEATKSLEVITDPSIPSTSHMPKIRDCGNNKVAVSIPQNACSVGRNMDRAQLQTAKPSGLRMPSPSLGFFGQPKASSLCNTLLKSSQPHNRNETNIPSLRKPGATNRIHDQRPPSHPGKIPNMINDVRTTGNLEVLSSSLECGFQSSVNPAPDCRRDENMKAVLKMNERQNLEVNVPCQAIKDQQQLHSILDDFHQKAVECTEPYEIETVSHREDIELPKINENLPLQASTRDNLDKSDDNKKVTDACLRSKALDGIELENRPSISCLSPAVHDGGVSGTNKLIDDQAMEDIPNNTASKNDGAFSGSTFGAASCNNTKCTLKANEDRLSSVHKVKDQCGEQAELGPLTSKDGKIFSETEGLWANDGSHTEDSGASGEIRNFNCEEDVSPKVQDCIETELEISHGHALHMLVQQTKDNGSKDDSTNSPAVDAQAESFVGGMSNVANKNNLSSPTVDSLLLVVVDEVNEGSEEELELHKNIECDMLKESNVGESKLESLSSLFPIPVAMQACDDDLAKTVECQDVDDAPSILVDCQPVPENFSCSTDMQFSHETELHGQVSLFKLNVMGKNHVTGNNCPGSEGFNGSKLESSHPACHLNTDMLVKVGSRIDDVIQQDDIEEQKCNSSSKIPPSIVEFQSGDDTSCNHQDTLIMDIDMLNCKHDANEHSVEQAKLNMPCPLAADATFEEAKSPETYHSLLFTKSLSFEGSVKLNGLTEAENSKSKGSSGSRSGSSHAPSQQKHMDQPTKEADGVNDDMLKESHEVQSPEGTILVACCDDSSSILAVNDQGKIVIDYANARPGHSELQNAFVAERVPQDDKHQLCFNHDLHSNTTSRVLEKESCYEKVLEQPFAYGTESKGIELFPQVNLALQDNNLDTDKKAEWLPMNDAVTVSVDIEPLVESHEHYSDVKSCHENGLNDEAVETAKLGADQISGAVATSNSKPFCSSDEEWRLSVITDRASESDNELKSISFPGEAESSVTQVCEMQHELDQVTYAKGDEDATTQPRKPENDTQQEALVLKPPPHAVPFSDEWLAAFEAAGEEILTMKGGAVQNSPPDKSEHEPGPWSPVKKKNNQGLGPFDCTKYTNAPSSNSQ